MCPMKLVSPSLAFLAPILMLFLNNCAAPVPI
jgi:hypothetical protein